MARGAREIEATNARLAEARAELSKRDASLTAARKIADTVPALEKQCEGLVSRVSALESQNAHSKETARVRAEQVAGLEKKLAAAAAERSTLRESLAAAEARIKALTAERESAAAETSVLRDVQAREVGAILASASREISALREENGREISTQRAAHEGELKALNDERAAERKTLEDEHASALKTLEDVECSRESCGTAPRAAMVGHGLRCESARSPEAERVDENAGAAAVPLSADELAALDAVLPPGAAEGTRYAAQAMSSLDR